MVKNKRMLTVGCHLSTAKGYLAMGQDALKIGANTFQFFSRNPRGSKAKAINQEDVSALRELMTQRDMSVILAHAPYTLNPCSAEPRTREFTKQAMKDDLSRMEHFPYQMYNFHPGSHTGQGTELGIELIVRLLNEVLRPEQTTTVLLETMAGKGTEIGGRFEELKQIIEQVELNEKLGVCLDTCHVFDGGYDIVDHLDEVLSEFDELVGLERLRAVHLNDSVNVLGSKKDRHAKLGEGNIGWETFRRIINHTKLRKLPFYLETPNDLDGYAKEISLLRQEYVEKD